MRIVDLFSLASGALLDFARSSIHVHESILFGQLMATLKKPGAKKRRPKNYHLLTKPRHEMRISGHRNRPKSPLS